MFKQPIRPCGHFKLNFLSPCFVRALYVLVYFLAFASATVSYEMAAAQEQGDRVVYVETKLAKVRSQPAHWAPALKDLSYGDKIVERNRSGGWLKVLLPDGSEGYLHESAVTLKVVVLKASVGLVGDVAASDIVLAGKGFSGEVEANYASDKSLNYEEVNRVEQYELPPTQIADFLREGGLNVAVH